LRRLGVIGRGGNVPNSPRKTQVEESPRLEDCRIVRNNRLGTPYAGKNFSNRQVFTTSEEIFLMAESWNSSTDVAIFRQCCSKCASAATNKHTTTEKFF
jgi:hypothetical protein